MIKEFAIKMRRIFYLLIFVLLFFSIIFVTFRNTSQKKQTSQIKAVEIVSTPTTFLQLSTPTISTVRPIYLGMWTQGFWDDTNKVLHPETLTSFEQKLGKRFAIAHYYRGWEYLDSEYLRKELAIIDSYGWRPMISANPYFFDRCVSNNLPLYKAIVQGNCDGFLQAAARNLKLFAKPVFLRLAWEMNINSMEWSIQQSHSSSEDFASAWRHMHDVFIAEQATNILWVFSPNVESNDSIPYENIYPGDSYVDWLGLDVYNWGNTQSWSTWEGFSELFSQSYSHIISIAPNKPLMIAEINTTDVGGDKARWYRNLLEQELPYDFPKVSAVVFYNEDRTQKEQVNWLIDISNESFTAFKKGLQKPFYQSSF